MVEGDEEHEQQRINNRTEIDLGRIRCNDGNLKSSDILGVRLVAVSCMECGSRFEMPIVYSAGQAQVMGSC